MTSERRNAEVAQSRLDFPQGCLRNGRIAGVCCGGMQQLTHIETQQIVDEIREDVRLGADKFQRHARDCVVTHRRSRPDCSGPAASLVGMPLPRPERANAPASN